MTRFVFDTGALIDAERGRKRALDFVALVGRGDAQVVTPVVCVVEWWRGRSDRREALLRSVTVEPLPLAAAKAAGSALAALKQPIGGKLSIDAAVMAFAALLDAPVVTSDLEDLGRLKAVFPSVRLLSA